MSMYAIETDRLTKRYGEVLAVQSVDLRVRHGEIYGFLGLNGAGKTTRGTTHRSTGNHRPRNRSTVNRRTSNRGTAAPPTAAPPTVNQAHSTS